MSRRLPDTLKNEREFNYQQYRHFMVTGNVKKFLNRDFLRIASATNEFLQFLPSMIGVVEGAYVSAMFDVGLVVLWALSLGIVFGLDIVSSRPD